MVDKQSTITAKQRQIAELKAQGLKNTEIGAQTYPNANPTSQRQLVSRELKKEAVAQYQTKVLDKVLKQNNITQAQYFMNLGLAMQATKIFTSHTEGDYELVDHTTRLRANQQAERYLGLVPTHPSNLEEVKEHIKGLASSSDELQITQALFTKRPPKQ